jgi:uncharacterized protein
MTTLTLAEESRALGAFYIPRFEIKIEGAGLPRDVLRDLVQLTYRDNHREIDGFELTVTNWNPATNTFKYIGSETLADLRASDPERRRFRLFEPCDKQVEVHMGYGTDLRLMVIGTFTTMEPNFPSGGAPTLTVRGLNVLHQLRRRQYTTTWGLVGENNQARESLIAQRLGEMVDRDRNEQRFPMTIEIDRAASQDEPDIEYLAQRNQYDIDFLLMLARRRGYVVFVRSVPRPGREPEARLYFGPSRGRVAGLRDVTYRLRWGRDLIDFKPTFNTARQVRAVAVRGWDRRNRRAIREAVTIYDLRNPPNADLIDLMRTGAGCEPGNEEEVVDEPVYTRDQARRRAEAILSDRLKELLTVSATTVGLPDLRSGQFVQIEGLGARLSGRYFVTETTHTISDAGYTTRFNARREEGGAQ